MTAPVSVASALSADDASLSCRPALAATSPTVTRPPAAHRGDALSAAARGAARRGVATSARTELLDRRHGALAHVSGQRLHLQRVAAEHRAGRRRAALAAASTSEVASKRRGSHEDRGRENAPAAPRDDTCASTAAPATSPDASERRQAAVAAECEALRLQCARHRAAQRAPAPGVMRKQPSWLRSARRDCPPAMPRHQTVLRR